MMEGQSSTSATLSIDEMACLIRAQLNYYHSLYQSHPHDQNLPLIHRVKKQIREVDPTAYEPIILSIGPYHHCSPSVLGLEKAKWNCLKAILDTNNLKELKDYLTGIMDIEEQVRSCYQCAINMESDRFLQMLLLDGCFLLYSLYATDEIEEASSQEYQGRGYDEDILIHGSTADMIGEQSTILSKHRDSCILAVESDKGKADGGQRNSREPGNMDNLEYARSQYSSTKEKWYSNFIARDMLLLENQIPFFVLKVIYDILACTKAVTTPLSETLAKYVQIIVQSYPKAISASERPKDFLPLLHLCHFYFRPSQNFPEHNEYSVHSLSNNSRKYNKLSNQYKDASSLLSPGRVHLLSRWRRAVQYHEAGVQFKRREHSKNAPHSLLDVSFDGGVLQIPCLPVDDFTNSLFRNLIAFEQACPRFGNDFTAYVAFISHLISTPDDVTFLSLRGIVVHHMRFDADISNIFGKLGENVDFDMNGSYYLKHLCQRLEGHYQNRINRWMAWLWQNHFSNPWLSLAVVAAAIVLICTILQTFTSLLAYVHPAA